MNLKMGQKKLPELKWKEKNKKEKQNQIHKQKTQMSLEQYPKV
jgi:hypothetical protein